MILQYKTVTADAQVVPGECYLMGVELTQNSATSLIIYDEATSDATAAQKVVTLRTSAEFQDAKRTFTFPGIKCVGLYAAWTAGVGTVYYYV